MALISCIRERHEYKIISTFPSSVAEELKTIKEFHLYENMQIFGFFSVDISNIRLTQSPWPILAQHESAATVIL